MGKIKFLTGIFTAKIIYFLIKAIKHSGGTSLAGMIALKICPDFLKYCRKNIDTAVNITGTNGKTTTSGILANILEADKQNVIHNLKGANMLTGIANTFALEYPFKRPNIAVLESDEAYLTKLYDYFKSDYLIVTNLFRDQLDRYGELSTTAGFIQNAIDKNNDLILFLNADDPLVAKFGQNRNNLIFYGMEDVEFHLNNNRNDNSAPSEVFNCSCMEKLKYSKQFFAQQGHYYCENCHYCRPEPNIKGYAKIYDNYSELKVNYNNIDYDFKINLIGLYNAYNALGAIAFALYKGIDYNVIRFAIKNYKSIFGRTEKRTVMKS